MKPYELMYYGLKYVPQDMRAEENRLGFVFLNHSWEDTLDYIDSYQRYIDSIKPAKSSLAASLSRQLGCAIVPATEQEDGIARIFIC